jgi:hypothetical protein
MTDIGSSTISSLHARLLRLPRDDQQQVIANLSAPCRAELAAYIQAMQRVIDGNEEPELEPDAGGSSASETLPSSPTSSLPFEPLRENSKDVRQLFARARIVREKLEGLAQEEPRKDPHWSAQEQEEGFAGEFGHTPSSSSSSSGGSDHESNEGDSTHSELPSSPGSFVLRALLRYLSEASTETRKSAIKSLTQDRRVELFAYMLTSEGRIICNNAFGEEELLEPDFQDLEGHYGLGGSDDASSSGDVTDGDDTDPSYTPFCQESFDTTSEAGSLPTSPTRHEARLPGTPSKRQLVFQSRNAMPLGALQPKQLSSRAAAPAKSAGMPPTPCIPKKQLQASGIDGTIVRKWLCGHISGPLCLARLLEGMQWGRFCGKKDAKRLNATEDLYSTNVSNGYGGPLGGMVGGVARAFAADNGTHLGGLFSCADGPQKALLQADKWVRSSVEEAAPEGRHSRQKRQHLEGLAEEDINLTFRRRCIALHPQRNGGDLEEYLKTHVYLEILRQWQEVGESPSLLDYQSSKIESFGLTDFELKDELQKEHARIVDDGKTADPDDLKERDDRISSHVLQLSWVKEKLEAEVNFMRSRGAYATIGVGPEASDAELARAYKAQALRLHPDRGGSTEAFQALQSAYERILKQRGGEGQKKGEGKTSKESDSATDTKTAGCAEEVEHEKMCEKPKHVCRAQSKKASAEESEHEAAPEQASVEQSERQEPKTVNGCASPEQVTSAKSSTQVRSQDEEVDERDDSYSKDSSPTAEQRKTVSRNDHETAKAEDMTIKPEVCTETDRNKVTDSGDIGSGYPVETPLDCDLAGDTRFKVEQMFAEGLDDTDVTVDADDLERSLVAAAAAIPTERVAAQAEMALQGAQMCFRAMRLCSRAAEVGSDAWPQLERLTSHVLEACQHVAEACGRTSSLASTVPGTVMPLLDAVSQRSACLRDSIVKQVIKGTQGLLHVTENVAALAKEVSLRQATLVKHCSAVLDTLHGLLGHEAMAASVCEGIADVIETIARLAREAAESSGTTSMAVSEAQRHAENLVEVLGAAGLWEKNAETKTSQPSAEKCGRGTREKEDSDEDSSDGEKEPWERHVEWTSLLQKLNGEVLTLQQELRQLVNQDPALIPAINSAQKEALFAVVVEMLAHARKAVSRTWYSRETSAPQDFAKQVEGNLSFIWSASHWGQIAVPSIEARLLRLAALCDSQLLCTILYEDVFQHALQLAPKAEEQILKAQFSAVAQAMRTGYAGG